MVEHRLVCSLAVMVLDGGGDVRVSFQAGVGALGVSVTGGDNNA